MVVVDDEADPGRLLCAHLRRAGCETLLVSSAEQALRLPGWLAPDLVILDLLLPGLDGWGLAGALGERWPGSPLVISSVLDPEFYPTGHTSLPKPFTGPQVRNVLGRLVPRWVAAA